MTNHVLSNRDRWFINKKRIDSLSRSQFIIGDAVVVCKNKHVMLADFYEGVCHTCNDRQTVPFCYANVEYGYKLTENDTWFIHKNPIDKTSKRRISAGDIVVICDNKHIALISSYNGRCPNCGSEHTGVIPERKELLAWLFPAKSTKKLLLWVNPVLGWTLGILFVVACALMVTDVISNERLIEHWNYSGLQNSQIIIDSIGDFILPQYGFHEQFVESSITMASRNTLIFNEMLIGLLALLNGFGAIYIYLRSPWRIVFERTLELRELFFMQTQSLVDEITTRVSNFFE